MHVTVTKAHARVARVLERQRREGQQREKQSREREQTRQPATPAPPARSLAAVLISARCSAILVYNLFSLQLLATQASPDITVRAVRVLANTWGIDLAVVPFPSASSNLLAFLQPLQALEHYW